MTYRPQPFGNWRFGPVKSCTIGYPVSSAARITLVLREGCLHERLAADHDDPDPITNAPRDEVVQPSFTASRRWTRFSSGSNMSRVSMEPERSTVSMRSRAGSIFSMGGSTNWGRAMATTSYVQASGPRVHCRELRRVTVSPCAGSRPATRATGSKNGILRDASLPYIRGEQSPDEKREREQGVVEFEHR